MSDVRRRNWNTPTNSKPTPFRVLDTTINKPKYIEARSGKVGFEAAIGKSALVQSGSGSQTQAGFYCTLCSRLCKDNVTYLDHLNSPFHLKNAGHKLEIKRATLSEVRARIAMHKRRKLESMVDYDLDKRVNLLKEQQEAEKQARKERKLAMKELRQSASGAANRRALLAASTKSSEDNNDDTGTEMFADPFSNVSLSEYSDNDDMNE